MLQKKNPEPSVTFIATLILCNKRLLLFSEFWQLTQIIDGFLNVSELTK